MKGALNTAILSVVLAGLFCGFEVSAQDTDTASVAPDEPMEANGVGISGGIIAGAEAVLIPMAIIDHFRPIKPIWPWIVFPVVGAAGGGVGGYYLEQASAGGAVALLVVSMVAIIPTAVAVVSAQSYDPSGENTIEGNSGDGFEAGEGGQTGEGAGETEVESRPEGIPGGAAAPPAPPSQSRLNDTERAKQHLASGSLLHLSPLSGVGVGIPSLDIRPVIVPRFDSFTSLNAGTSFMVSLLRVDLP